MKKIICFLCLLLWLPCAAHAWGFYGHKKINRLAVFTLPPEMIGFYKYYIVYITENAVNPDKRRYAVEGEAEKHYIDLDVYDEYYGGKGKAMLYMPRYWKEAVEFFSEDTLRAYGIGPWNVELMKYKLTNAFKNQDVKEILRLSTELGHYIGDANVPLHSTVNYNGQFTDQYGIHGFWESRLPELFSEDYDFFVGKAAYVENTQLAVWDAVIQAHTALDSVFDFERELTAKFDDSKKYTYEERNKVVVRTYSRDFSKAYHSALDGQVERHMRRSVLMLGSFWYTCWVDAGSPDLEALLSKKYEEELLKEQEEEEKLYQQPLIESRPHESTWNGIDYVPDNFQGLLYDSEDLKYENLEGLLAPPGGHTGNCCQPNPYLDAYKKKAGSTPENPLLTEQ